MKVYIAGPMSGIPEYNFPAFNRAAELWRERGWEVVNPAELDGEDTSQRWDYYLRRDLKVLVDCDAIALLPGYEQSRGAMLERTVAVGLGLRVFDAFFPARPPATDHVFYESAVNPCCDLPDYMHLPLWRHE